MLLLHNSQSDITSTSTVYGGLDQWLHVQVLPSELLISGATDWIPCNLRLLVVAFGNIFSEAGT